MLDKYVYQYVGITHSDDEGKRDPLPSRLHSWEDVGCCWKHGTKIFQVVCTIDQE